MPIASVILKKIPVRVTDLAEWNARNFSPRSRRDLFFTTQSSLHLPLEGIAKYRSRYHTHARAHTHTHTTQTHTRARGNDRASRDTEIRIGSKLNYRALAYFLPNRTLVIYFDRRNTKFLPIARHSNLESSFSASATCFVASGSHRAIIALSSRVSARKCFRYYSNLPRSFRGLFLDLTISSFYRRIVGDEREGTEFPPRNVVP